MRFEYYDQPGWKTLQKCACSLVLHELIHTHIARLPPMDLRDRESQIVSLERGNTQYTLRVLKSVRAPAGGSVDIQECTWHRWRTSDTGSLWRQSFDADDCLYYQQHHPGRAAAGPPGPLQKLSRALAPGEREALSGTRSVGGRCCVDVLVRLPVDVCRVCFSSDDSVKELHLFSRARCVNACYTTCITGMVDSEHMLKTINTNKERGPCGSEFYISSVFGVFQVFPSSHGARRVTCKAFTNVTETEFALRLTCSGLGVSMGSPLLVHMIVMHGNTGRQLDISASGNLVYCIQRKFRNVTYTEKLDEVNVHALFKWHDIPGACAVCPEALQRRMANKYAVLQRVELTVSVTRLGTCIYRVGVKKAPPVTDTDPGFAEPDTADVEQCLFSLCEYIHSFLTHDM